MDYALIESGLGGRLDNTNVISHPELEIVTTIAYDHMNILGSRIQQIAFEKAGIIQKRTTCVIGYLPKTVLPVFERKAVRMQAALVKCPAYDDLGGQSLRFDHVVVDKYAIVHHIKELKGTDEAPVYVKRRDRI